MHIIIVRYRIQELLSVRKDRCNVLRWGICSVLLLFFLGILRKIPQYIWVRNLSTIAENSLKLIVHHSREFVKLFWRFINLEKPAKEVNSMTFKSQNECKVPICDLGCKLCFARTDFETLYLLLSRESFRQFQLSFVYFWA